MGDGNSFDGEASAMKTTIGYDMFAVYSKLSAKPRGR